MGAPGPHPQIAYFWLRRPRPSDSFLRKKDGMFVWLINTQFVTQNF